MAKINVTKRGIVWSDLKLDATDPNLLETLKGKLQAALKPLGVYVHDDPLLEDCAEVFGFILSRGNLTEDELLEIEDRKE